MSNNHLNQQEDHLIYIAATNNNETANFASAILSYGYELKIFDNVDDLIKTSIEQEPDALIVDRDATEGQLAESVMQVLYKEGKPFFPIVMISSKNDFTERLHAVRADIDGFFIKPINIPALIDRINEKVARKKIPAYRILVVDDDLVLGEFYQVMLNLARMHVKVINDPTKILEELPQFQPELILMDMYMQNCTGAEIANLLRQNNLYLDVPIVFLSSEDNIEKQVNAIETGADYFLTKPIDPDNLISVVTSRAERYRTIRKSTGTGL
jgi:DNA-binding response OmpR family regulator